MRGLTSTDYVMPMLTVLGKPSRTATGRMGRILVMLWTATVLLSGCYAPLRSPGIPAHLLTDDFRLPYRTSGVPLSYASLVAAAPRVYTLGPGDLIEVTVTDLLQRGDATPFRVQVLDSGEITLPRVGDIPVDGLSLAQAQARINQYVGDGILQQPNTTVKLLEKGTVSVLVLGAVLRPGVHKLPRFENDVAHALAAAGGFSPTAGEVLEIHRRFGPQHLPAADRAARPAEEWGFPAPSPGAIQDIPSVPPAPGADLDFGGHSLLTPGPTPPSPTVAGVSQGLPNGHLQAFTGPPIAKISLRGQPFPPSPQDVVLDHGDVLVIPEKQDQVFFVVGPLSESNRVRFTVNDRDREIGSGFLLPDNREIDVVTAVAMAGYIDPIYSPTTVTVHRVMPDGRPLLIRVDLIAARADPRETVLVQPGDIIYLNPDNPWYVRRLIDRVIDRALGTAVGRWLTN